MVSVREGGRRAHERGRPLGFLPWSSVAGAVAVADIAVTLDDMPYTLYPMPYALCFDGKMRGSDQDCIQAEWMADRLLFDHEDQENRG